MATTEVFVDVSCNRNTLFITIQQCKMMDQNIPTANLKDEWRHMLKRGEVPTNKEEWSSIVR